jgi:hypothetical protein
MTMRPEPEPPPLPASQLSTTPVGADGYAKSGTRWFYVADGEQIGPLSSEIMTLLLQHHFISPETLVWKKEFDKEWRSLKHTELAGALTGRLMKLTTQAHHVLTQLELAGHYVGYRPAHVLLRTATEERTFADSDAIEEYGRQHGYL